MTSEKSCNYQLKSGFESAHCVKENDGSDEKIHGHSWKVSAIWQINIDRFNEGVERCKKGMGAVIKKIDHLNLNDLSEFSDKTPTAELIAEYLQLRLSRLGNGIKLISIQIEEETGFITTIHKEKSKWD